MSEITRAEHIAWVKQRAKECLHYKPERPVMVRIGEALASVASDLPKEDCVSHDQIQIIVELGSQLVYSGHMVTIEEMEHWIDGIG